MKKVGIVGGIGPCSTLDYYNGIIDGYRLATGSENYPPIVIDSIDMTEMCGYMERKSYDHVASMLISSVRNLEAAGADFALIASNTPHVVFDKIAAGSDIPVISIVEETCKFSAEKGYKSVMIIGTGFTMNNSFYPDCFRKYGINAFMPNENDKQAIMNIIFPNLENGIVIPEDKEKMLQISMRNIEKFNADALVLGCTEIPLMIKQTDIDVPIINTAAVHINSAVQRLIRES